MQQRKADPFMPRKSGSHAEGATAETEPGKEMRSTNFCAGSKGGALSRSVLVGQRHAVYKNGARAEQVSIKKTVKYSERVERNGGLRRRWEGVKGRRGVRQSRTKTSHEESVMGKGGASLLRMRGGGRSITENILGENERVRMHSLTQGDRRISFKVIKGRTYYKRLN